MAFLMARNIVTDVFQPPEMCGGGFILMARNIVGNVFQPPEMCAVEVFLGG